MVGMSGGASAVATNHPLLLATVARGATSVVTAAGTRGSAPFFFNNGLTLGRNALVGGLALAGQRTFVSLPEGAQEVGKMVSSAADKMGLGDNQVYSLLPFLTSARYL